MHIISIKSTNFVRERVRSLKYARFNDLVINLINFTIAPEGISNLPAGVQKLQVTTAAHLKQQELLKQVAEQQFIPKEPPPEFEFIADPPSISALDLYVSF